MKTLTLWQPWATLIAIDAKHYETRSWPTKYRGPLAIHASLHDMECDVVKINSFYREAFERAGIESVKDLPFGKVLCIVDLTDCIRTETVLMLSQAEAAFGDYSPCRFAWKLENLRVLPEPIPARGKQGLWEWNEENHG